MTDPIDLTLSSDEESPPDDPPQPQPQRRGRRRGDQPQPDLGMIVPVNVDEREQEVNLPTPTLTNNDTDEGLKPSTTSGTGLWDLWTRNFKSPLFALLDLIDNSVDAALLQKGCKSDIPGRVQIYRDVYKHGRHSYTTGLCIRNNSMNKITSLDLALNHLFSSDKVTPNTIGENGVGMKQAAASLSDMTFVLVKNGSNEELELGIIAKVLQNEVGCFLPCFKFNDLKNLSKKMTEVFKQSQYASVAKCVAEYGKVTTDGVPSLDKGIERLCKHFEDICKKFHDNPYVFEVILDKVHDRNSKHASGAKDKQATVAEIMKTLQNDIPMRYLHIDETFKFSVGKKELTFRYWQERLVEFTEIEIPVRSKTPWHENFGVDMPDQYWLRIFLGFDRFRIAESDVEPETGIKKSNKQCSLYIYSRMSGRLILRERDSRVRLRLNAGGTEFCQALTVIIDDVDGHLPVNPTKQDVVFSNQSQGGDTHEENLYTMVRTVVAFYYTHHKKKYGGKKNILTSKISQFVDRELPDGMKSCANCKLTTYKVLFNQTNTNMIRVDHSEEEPGVDTVFRLQPEEKTLKSPGRTARKRKPSSTKKNSNPEADEELEAANKKRSKKDTKRHSPTGMRSTPRRAAGRPKKYGDDFNDNGQSDSEDTSSEERGDNVKKSKNVGKGCLDLCMSSDDESESRYGKKSRNPKIISPGPKGKESNEALENRIDELEIENSILKAKTETLQEELKAAKRNIRMLEREIQRAEE
mmetsp:Transcript_6212/g.10433  ORF Transcript_6212/g.10433 Transcript_6212/m.10433 type:complete len:750 (-) Transcript_6212:1055-3304(-)